ncbi:Rap1a/Tai family immunity protein [Azospirillum sp. sgz301742]
MRSLALGLALLSVLAGGAHADSDAALRRALAIESVSDLAAACRGITELAGREDDRDETYRLLSCISYVRGTQALYASYQKAFGTRTFCLPAGVTLGDQIGAFLAWTDANQDRRGENAGQGFIVSLVHGFPCAETAERAR